MVSPVSRGLHHRGTGANEMLSGQRLLVELEECLTEQRLLEVAALEATQWNHGKSSKSDRSRSFTRTSTGTYECGPADRPE